MRNRRHGPGEASAGTQQGDARAMYLSIRDAMVAGDEPMRGLERRRLTVMLFPSDNPPTYSIVDSQIRLTGEER